jgi:ArsR family transcriptional regulator
MHESIDMKAALVLAALGNHHRLQVVRLLRKGERCVCEITPALDLDQSVVSRHLSTLTRAGVLRHRRDGRRVFYQIADRRYLTTCDRVFRAIASPLRARPVGSVARRAGP